MVFCAEFCPWMTDMKEVKEEDEGLLERKASRLVRLTKPTSNYRHIGIFFAKKPQINYFSMQKGLCLSILSKRAIICGYLMFFS